MNEPQEEAPLAAQWTCPFLFRSWRRANEPADQSHSPLGWTPRP